MIQVCRDTSDAAALYLPQRLYLKPFAKLNISVQLPPSKVSGKSLSNWELMEKIRKMAQPESFSTLKVSKHSTEVIRFEAEMENPDNVNRVIQRLNERIVQLTNYPDQLKLKVSEAKSDFPSRHSWDSYFRDATDMDEMKPGERPDTVHICNLPISWFLHERDKDEDSPPSESLFKKVFEKFGSIRQVDVPVADPYRMHMKSTMRGMITPPQDAALYFDGYIQFSEYVGFVRCMDALRGKKLLRKRDSMAEWCPIKVDFDKTKHMTDAAVKRRGIVRERLASRQRAKDDAEKEAKEKAARREARERQKETCSRLICHSLRHKHERVEQEKLQKMKEREERRKKKNLAKLMERDNVDLNGKVAEEQNKLTKVQKSLQAVRIIEELFKRIELRPELQNSRERRGRYFGEGAGAGERSARSRIVDRFKRQYQAAVDDQRNQLKCALDGRIVIRSALETKKVKRDSSMESISSDEKRRREYKRIKSERLTTPERETEYNKAATAGMYSMPGPYQFGYPFGMPQPTYPFPPQNPMYYPVRGAYYPPPEGYVPRRGGRGVRGRGRGRPRMPYFDGPDASHQYYKYFKKLSENESRNEHDDRNRSRSRTRSRSRSRRRSYSRSRSRRRSYSRSRSRGRRSRSRSRSRSRTRSRRSRSRSRRSRSHHSRSRSRRRSKSLRRSKSKTPQRTNNLTPEKQNGGTASPKPRERSKSWDLPKDGDTRKSWSKSPKM